MTISLTETQGFLKVLASESRQKLLLEVFAHGEERTVGQVAEQSGLAQSTASEYLAMMRDAGVLRSRREGKEVFYQPDGPSIMAHLARFVEIVSSCCPR
ncbi:MAG: ArsR family transcriptional regulator [Salinibacterium sp.]|nr:MAG: ArsR family transcriptional regulator [Salinibacterium sp.]